MKRHDTNRDSGNSLKTFFCGLIIGVCVTYFSGVSKPSVELAVESVEISEARTPKTAHVMTSSSKTVVSQASPTYQSIKKFMGGDYGKVGKGDGSWHHFTQPLDRKPAPIIYGFGVGKEISWDTSVVERCNCEMWAFDNTPVAMKYINGYDADVERSNGRLKPLPRDKWHLVKYLLSTKTENLILELPPGHTISFGPSLPKDVTEDMFESLSESRQQKARGIKERGADTFEAPARSLEFLMDHLGHKKVDIIKMDIESAEFGIIRDWAKKGWTPPVCQLLIEFHARLLGKEGPGKYQQALADLHNLGFTEFYASDEQMDHGFINLDYC